MSDKPDKKLNMKKRMLIVGTTAVVGLGALGVAGVAGAKSDGGNSLIDKLVSTFHLNKADVQKVFDQQHSQNQAARQTDVKTRLDQAVKDGKLTQDQATKIIAKLAELEKTRADNRAAMSSQTPAERKAAMEAERTSLQQWAKDNNIPEQYLMLGAGRGTGGRGMMGGRGRHAGNDSDDTSPSPSVSPSS